MMTAIRPNPTVQIPPTWDCGIHSPLLLDKLTALKGYLHSEEADAEALCGEDDVPPVDIFSCDQFRMYEFKVRKCARGRSHDWTDCPFAHPGEKARRRDPRCFCYSGTACPDFRKGGCEKGDSCEFAHGVFECWLHPERYRTRPCKDGLNCCRRVCFFAHTPEQLRMASPRSAKSCESDYSGSPMRHGFDSYLAKAARSFMSSQSSIPMSPPISPPAESPPMSPSSFGMGCSVNDILASMRNVQINKMNMSHGLSIPRPGHYALTSKARIESREYRLAAAFDAWDGVATYTAGVEEDEEIQMERVESGRDLRARIYAKLSKDNSLERARGEAGPDVGWVSELVK
ncbi:hypothetical protein MLD38_015412 [Melastoma candidum]|uniref:Uncharacterized protein n=1 Tax=Melastoma candidum TaxID=119954 RepID=A0ACB9RPH2_9MYRT|nr:hypothetical protein MLD38_015412 [Melastoma candidum]